MKALLETTTMIELKSTAELNKLNDNKLNVIDFYADVRLLSL